MVTRSLVSYVCTKLGVWLIWKHWMVTRSLVSYVLEINISWIWLFDWMVTRSLVSYVFTRVRYDVIVFNWMVTRSLVSYVLAVWKNERGKKIEWSPDHWWVTSELLQANLLKVLIEWSPDHWWVTSVLLSNHRHPPDWMVTRSLVSYVLVIHLMAHHLGQLNGHQIIGELRQILIMNLHWFLNWMVTRSLVSYVSSKQAKSSSIKLNGHQIIGELRLS